MRTPGAFPCEKRYLKRLSDPSLPLKYPEKTISLRQQGRELPRRGSDGFGSASQTAIEEILQSPEFRQNRLVKVLEIDSFADCCTVANALENVARQAKK